MLLFLDGWVNFEKRMRIGWGFLIVSSFYPPWWSTALSFIAKHNLHCIFGRTTRRQNMA